MGEEKSPQKRLDKTDKNFLNFKVDKSPDFAMQRREIIPRGDCKSIPCFIFRGSTKNITLKFTLKGY